MSLELERRSSIKHPKNNRINSPNLAKKKKSHKSTVQEFQWISNQMNLLKYKPRHNIVKLLKNEDKENTWKSVREKKTFTYNGKKMKWQWISHNKSSWNQKEVAEHFSSAGENKEKALSTQNPILSENILQKWRGNQHIHRWRKTKRIYCLCILKWWLKEFIKTMICIFFKIKLLRENRMIQTKTHIYTLKTIK